MLSLLVLAVGDTSAATLRWTGAHATSSDWSRGANWDTGTAPANGDTLVFPAGAARLANNNDLTGLQVAIIRFNGTGGGYTLSGNGVVVTDGINANQTAGNNTVALARITLANPMSFSVAQVGFLLTIDSEVRLNGNDLTADPTGLLVLRGVISGAGNVIKTGDGLLTVSGPVGNTFTGDLRVNAGTVLLGKAAGLSVTNRLIIGDGAGGSQADGVGMLADNQVTAVTINSSGLWSLGNFENEVSDLVLNRGGDVTTGASGKLRLGTGTDITATTGDTPGTVESSISGNLELAVGNHRFEVDNGDNTLNNSTLLIDAVISGPGGINKQGRDNLELAGANTFAGTVIVNSGTLIVNHDLALGLTTSGTRVNDSAQLRLLADVSGESLTLDSGGFGPVFPAALDVSGQQVWTGNVTLLRDSTISVEGTIGLLDLSSVISGSGAVTKTGLGTLRFSGTGANTYTGATYVNEGTLELDKGTIGGVLAVPGRLIIGDGVGGEHADVARHRKNNQVNTVTVNGSGLWDLGTHEEEVSDLVLNDGGDVTTAATGLMRLGIGADVSGVRTSSDSDPFGTITGNLELLLGAHTFRVDAGVGVSGGYTISVDAAVSGLGGITKEGPHVLALSRANTFAGSVTVNAGKMVAYDPQALGSTLSGTRINSGTSFEMVFDGTVAGEAITLDNSTLTSIKHIVWSGNVTLLGQATVNAGSSSTFDSSLDISGVIGGTGGFTKRGKDPLLLSGNAPNTYSGLTTVNEGRLQLNKAGVNAAVNSALIIGDGTGGANADVVECLGLNQVGGVSAVTVNSSGLFIAQGETVGDLDGSGNIEVSSYLNANQDHSTMFSGVISGAGAFNKYGPGTTLTLTGNNTYTGGTGVAFGTLLINGQQPAGPVFVQPNGTLGGIGRVGNLSTFANGPTVSPGASPGRLTSGNVFLGANSIFRVELDGPTPGATHDQLRALGTVNLGGAELQATLNFIPTLGQPLVIIDNDGVDAVVDQFKGLAEGDTLRVNQIPFVVSYKGGDGNDVTLTATNRSLSLVSTRVESGNGNGVIDPSECDHLFVALMNETGNPLAVSHVVLDSATPGVAVTRQSSEYAPFGPLDIRTNRTPFQIRTTPDFVCGQLIDFLLTVTVTGGGGGTFTIPFTVPSGSAGAPVPFDNGANLNLPDLASATSTITVANAAPYVGKVAVSLHITHPSAGDLILRLRSPSGTTVLLANNRGGATDNYGGGCGQANRTTFDDAASTKIVAGAASFIGGFTPEEPLAAFLGENPNGDWQLLISDTVAGDTGELRCWSLFLSPPDCTDGGGACESCVPALTGRFTADMPSTTTRLVRNGVPSGCGSPKACPAVVTGPRLFYRVHLITNNGPETCVTAVLADLCRTSNLRLHAAAYLTSYNPADPCANYLGDTASELTTGSTSFSCVAPQNAVIALVVSSPVSATTCPVGYLAQLHGLPCPPPVLHIAKTGNPDEVRFYWSTAYPDFDLQRAPNLNGLAPYPFVNIPFTPFVANGDYSVTNKTMAPQNYYRLRKP
jgi:autotransporter-associated beta strand protein